MTSISTALGCHSGFGLSEPDPMVCSSEMCSADINCKTALVSFAYNSSQRYGVEVRSFWILISMQPRNRVLPFNRQLISVFKTTVNRVSKMSSNNQKPLATQPEV